MDSCRNCNNRDLCFKHLSGKEVNEIIAKKTQIIYNKGETIIKQGIPVTFYLNIRQGLIKLHVEQNKKINILGIISSGQIIGLNNIGRKGVYDYSATAIMDQTEVCLLDAVVVNQVMKKNGEFAISLFERSNQYSFDLINKLNMVTGDHLKVKLAMALLSLSGELKHSYHDIIPLTHKEIGELINISAGSVSRLIKLFKENGIIDIEKGKIKIKDFDILEKASEII